MELKTYFAQDAAGNIITSAIVNVFLQGTTTLATGLTRADGTPLENPFAADGAGRIQFRAPDGYYDVQVSAGPGIIQTLTIQCVDYSEAKADADRAESAADRSDVSAEQAQDALNSITGINTNFEKNSREQWHRSLAEAGITLVSGSFEEGATANSSTDAVWHIAGGQCYTWDGAFPKTVPANSTPTSTGGVGPSSWVSVGDALLRSELSNPTGAGMIGISPSGNLQQSIYWATPEQFGAVGDGVTDDTASVTAAIMTGRCVFKRGATYRLVMTEANVITPPAGAIIDFNGAKITHETMGFLVILNKNPDVTILNFNGVYKGTYPTTVTPTTRYGISRPHEAAFTGFIGMNGSAKRFTLNKATVAGASASNKYDFLVSGYEGDFEGSVFKHIYGTHYSDLLINNFHKCLIEHVYGTLRHDDSYAIYGPSHMMYIGLNGGTIRHVREFGALLSNTHSGAEATIQLTGGTNALVEDIVTTMDDVGVIAYKNVGDGATFRKIVSRSAFSSNKNSRLFETQTNLQASILNTTIDDVKLFLPAGNLKASAFWCGGTRTKARNVYIDVPYTDEARTAEVAFLVTSDYADVELDISSSKLDSKVLLSDFDNSKLKINNLNNPISLVSNTSMTGASWGECQGTTVDIVDNLTAAVLSTVDVNAETLRKCAFAFAGIYNGDQYKHTINNSVTTTLSVTFPLRLPPTTAASGDQNVLAYEIAVTGSSIDGVQAVASRHFLFLSGNGGSITATAKDVSVQQLGDVAILPSLSVNTETGLLTVTITRQAGGSNLRDLTARVKLINIRPHI